MTRDRILAHLEALPAWPEQGDLRPDQWRAYFELARLIQQTPEAEVERALEIFGQRLSTREDEEEVDASKAFLLLRVVFDLPDSGPVEDQAAFVGWSNWPEPDAEGRVNLGWPIRWAQPGPFLEDPRAGYEGLRYLPRDDYRHLRARYPHRRLKELQPVFFGGVGPK